MSITIMHTSDFHGFLTHERAMVLKELRKDVNYYFDSGDLIKTGNLTIPYSTLEDNWGRLAFLNCSASTLGNREVHPLKYANNMKIYGARHPILCANLFNNKNNLLHLPYKVFSESNLRVGVFGVMIPILTEASSKKIGSNYYWKNPFEIAIKTIRKIRKKCDVIIALTHIGLEMDMLLASLCPEISIILGGHSHDILEKPVKVNDTFICHTGSHGKYVGMYHWNKGVMEYDLKEIKH